MTMRSSFVFTLLFASAAFAASSPQVSIMSGTLLGGYCNNTANAVYFKGIPFAQPPIDSLRFASPLPYNGTYPGGTRLATTSASSCIQFGTEFATDNPPSEDCLYLDIWVPANATNTSALPVKVWIFGGGEDAGGSSFYLYDGCNIASQDAILVSINYRLGPLGFLALASAGIQGNQGIQDLLLGLQWIKSNIQAFGGDLKKVLLFGQSAGATNTFIIATLPQASTLINAAVAESGGGRDALLNSTAQNLGKNFAQNLSCGLSDGDCLRSKSLAEMHAYYDTAPLLNTGLGNECAIGVNNILTPQSAPYVDGVVIAKQPSQVGVQVPTIFGSNSLEGSLFALGQFAAEGGANVTTADDYSTFLQENFGSTASTVRRYYPLTAFNSTPYPAFFAISKVLSDAEYFCPAYRGLNRGVANGIPVWSYIFSHTSSCIWLQGIPQDATPLLGAAHTAEIPYTLGNLVDLPNPNRTCNFTAAERNISAILLSAWTSMAANANPLTGGFDWPPYSLDHTGGINITDSVDKGVIDYSVCALWDRINQGFMNASSTSSAGNVTASQAPANSASGSRFHSVGGITIILALGAMLM